MRLFYGIWKNWIEELFVDEDFEYKFNLSFNLKISNKFLEQIFICLGYQ